MASQQMLESFLLQVMTRRQDNADSCPPAKDHNVSSDLYKAWRAARPGIVAILDDSPDVCDDWTRVVLYTNARRAGTGRATRHVRIYITRRLPMTAWIKVADEIGDYLEGFDVGLEARLLYDPKLDPPEPQPDQPDAEPGQTRATRRRLVPVGSERRGDALFSNFRLEPEV
ncbi:hypothetical protein O9K51_05836 [Purpureocillium lavendulum]|uniref:Uncharacterized protein n=1 Tax=Purpureocillium lavendulum TaxID=1247861 RepID=A0AB34FUD6_9HYPO|nr:hypothetical protein O9K51_05836 [Purpureocillium lavendulum]